MYVVAFWGMGMLMAVIFFLGQWLGLEHAVNAHDKALPHVVTGLIAKRAELAGRIEHLRAQVRQATIELDHIEASIRIFQPDIDMETLGTRPVPAIHHAFKGETTRSRSRDHPHGWQAGGHHHDH